MKWWQRQSTQMWSGSMRWLPIMQICLCVAMAASRIVQIVGGNHSPELLAFTIGWGVMLCFWLVTLATYIVTKSRLARMTTPGGEG